MGAGVNKLVFTLKVGTSTLSGAPPSSQWYIIWNRQVPDVNFDRWYVAMKSDATGAISFEYGKFGVPTNTSTATLPPPNSTSTNQSVKLGNADGGSYDPATGTIYAAFQEYTYPWDYYLVTRTSTNGTSWNTRVLVGYDRSVAANGRFRGGTPSAATTASPAHWS